MRTIFRVPHSFYEVPEVLEMRPVNGAFKLRHEGFEANVYLPHLSYFLNRKEVPIERSEEFFDGTEFKKFYVEGYKKGVEYFKTRHSIDNATLYNNNEVYIRDLHINYFHKAPAINCGWNYYEMNPPPYITEKLIEEYGFYSGIISELKTLQEAHPVLFKDFRFMCELELEENGITHKAEIKDNDPPITYKHYLLYLYLKDHEKLDREKHINKLARKLQIDSATLRNDYRDLEAYVLLKETSEIKITNWEKKRNDLQQPSFIKKIRQLNIT